ncbi:hypothetical protein [Candidatus Oscillochloris fontis]|uniref:hypothetical protein n=1 Tax=Candidatus Oscillochloris fontis TaxID=2496868 RepID=UPI00101B5D63|nr:hypothetical protein [Candidatus Oscillochloris fontis]
MIYAGQAHIRSVNFKPTMQLVAKEELDSEQRWSESFARSQDALMKLAERARQNYLAGKTELLDPDKL